MRDGSPVTLYCFAHAGAGVSGFAHWRAGTGPGVATEPVLLPGRDARRREPRATSRDQLLGALLTPLADQVADGRPYVLYGHSLGGIVAYTLARALIDRGLPAPALLAVGASLAPHTAPLRHDDDITDEQLLRFVTDLGEAPRGALAAPGSLWYRSVLPVLRDDLRLAVALRAAALANAGNGPLPVPVLAVGGHDDPVVGAAALDGWARWTTGRFVRRTVPGDHFFVRSPHAPRLIGRACRVVRRTRLVPGLISGGQL
ncbi:thioesterase II family protein [Streptomyces jeddahensis]|uniref:Linear gramicidin dehydrogenase LgrE n=1 Tax=Streptomyces jeddahensis TaxID=1716141 RepID=A0A177HK31_9ACTN|nr:thioesterase domain-containing protein [Streptomyces jeddahensis]OAH10970.1 linear gramicidin dehydrogenase LgrE [Streptomyces jeddahensis]